MDFMKLATKRHSVRKFKDYPISQENIDSILKAGSTAPTAHNNQPESIIVVKSKAGLSLIKKCTECHYNAPLVFIISYDKNKDWKRSYDGKRSGDIDASIVATHMMLEATELGIGSTWIMYFIPEAVKVEFELPENIEPVAILVMGYAAEETSSNSRKKCRLMEYVSYR